MDPYPNYKYSQKMGEGGASTPEKNEPKMSRVRILTAFWLLGMCNNFGYVVMLSAAHDLLSKENGTSADLSVNNSTRHCNQISTGAILLADILPSVIVKLLSPFFPLWIHLRLIFTIITSIAGYILAASKGQTWLVISGVVFTSVSSGLGESSLLMYMSFFKDKNVISTWSSGTGGAGVFGSLSYLGLVQLGVDRHTTIYSMLIVPFIMGFVFWFLLVRPDTKAVHEPTEDVSAETKIPISVKLKIGWRVFYIYMLPFGLVYLFEYFINQGLAELIYFESFKLLDSSGQYRVYSFTYQVGVLLSRSSVNLIAVDNTWLLAVLQGINVIIMSTEAVYSWLNSFWVVIVLIVWEGLLGGCSYVNTYRRINKEMPPEQRQFAMSMNSFGDAIGITLAGLLAIPAHNAICQLPPP